MADEKKALAKVMPGLSGHLRNMAALLPILVGCVVVENHKLTRSHLA